MRAASSPSQSMPIGLDSSPKVGALGSPRKLHLYAKASPFEERLPPRRGKMSRSDKRGSVDLRSKDEEGELAGKKASTVDICCSYFAQKSPGASADAPGTCVNCGYFARLVRMVSHCSTVEESIRL